MMYTYMTAMMSLLFYRYTAVTVYLVLFFRKMVFVTKYFGLGKSFFKKTQKSFLHNGGYKKKPKLFLFTSFVVIVVQFMLPFFFEKHIKNKKRYILTNNLVFFLIL